MDEREKIQTEIETRMVTFNDTINEIKTLAEKKNEDLASDHIKGIFDKHREAQSKIEDLKKADDRNWGKIRHDLENLMGDLGEEMRQSLAYFK